MAAAGLPVFHDGNENTSGFAGGKLHHKVMIIDAGTDSDPTVVTGSYNWSAAASEDNDEHVLVMRADELVQPFRREFCASLDEAVLHPAFDGELPDPCTGRVRSVRINEFLPNPDQDGATDVFVEIVNAGAAPVDLSGWTLGDENDPHRHLFATGSYLAPGAALVLFDRGDHGDIVSAIVSTTGTLSLINSGDTVTLRDRAGVAVATAAWSSCRDGVSLNRELAGDPDAPLVQHDDIPGNAGPNSPGTRIDGEAF